MTEIKNLIEGYREFYRKYFTSGDTLYEELAKSQSPKTLVVACSDSRADPSIITNAGPGDIFVVRNVANLVPPYESGNQGQHGVSAALEFGVCVLEVRHIIILGHSNCAGIGALLNPGRMKNTDFIGKWMDIAKPAKEKVAKLGAATDAARHQCEKEAIQLSLQNLLTFPWIRSAVEKGTLRLHGWYFSISGGTLEEYNPNTDRFEHV
jgi:carbonic anhydrase